MNFGEVNISRSLTLAGVATKRSKWSLFSMAAKHFGGIRKGKYD